MTPDGPAPAPHAAADAGAAARGSTGWQTLLRCAQGCSLVITEDMPVTPDEGWARALREQLPDSTEVWAVDTACMAPMQSVGKRYVAMSGYRKATQDKRKDRMRAMYGAGDQVMDHTGDAVRACGLGAAPRTGAGGAAPAVAPGSGGAEPSAALKAEPQAAGPAGRDIAANAEPAAAAKPAAKRKAPKQAEPPEKLRRGPTRNCRAAAEARASAAAATESSDEGEEDDDAPAAPPEVAPAAAPAAPEVALEAPAPAGPPPTPVEVELALGALDLREFIKRVPWVDQGVARALS